MKKINDVLENFINNISDKDRIYVRGLNLHIKSLVEIMNKKGISTSQLEKMIGIKWHSINWWYTQGFSLSRLQKLNEIYIRAFRKGLPLDTMRFGCKASPANIKIPPINKDVSYLLGYLYGDGTLYSSKKNSRIEFYDCSKEMLIKISNIIFNEFDFKDFKLIKDKRSNCYILRINSLVLGLLFNEILGVPKGKKKGKLKILRLIKDSRYIKEFISGFFDAEGHIYYTPKYGYRITLTQNDKFFLEEIHQILSFFNILNIKIVDYRGNGIFELRINTKKNFNKFISTFNLRHPDKQRRIELAIQGKSTVKNPRN